MRIPFDEFNYSGVTCWVVRQIRCQKDIKYIKYLQFSKGWRLNHEPCSSVWHGGNIGENTLNSVLSLWVFGQFIYYSTLILRVCGNESQIHGRNKERWCCEVEVGVEIAELEDIFQVYIPDELENKIEEEYVLVFHDDEHWSRTNNMFWNCAYLYILY